MNLNFLWTVIGGVIAFIGFVAAIQQLIEYGWNKCIRAFSVALLSLLPLLIVLGFHFVVGAAPAGSQKSDAPSVEPSPSLVPVPKPPPTPSGPTPDAKAPNPSPKTQNVQLPTQLSSQQMFFRPDQVIFCPSCGKAYASLGPKEHVECIQCRKVVNLVPRYNVAVWRCRNCRGLCTLESYIGRKTLVSCPVCKEKQIVP